MLPRWHIFWGAVFTLIVWAISPSINVLYLVVIFFSSFLMDFDHYLVSLIKTKKIRLKHAFKYHDLQRRIEEKEKKRGIRRKGYFHIFHTIEFLILVAIVGYFVPLFFYVFIGLVFHSLLDFLWLIYEDRLYRREYFLSSWFFEKIKRS